MAKSHPAKKNFRAPHQGNKNSPPSGAKKSFAARPPPKQPQNHTREKRPAQFEIPKGFRISIGVHAVMEALNVRPGEVEKVFVREDATDHAEIVQACQRLSVKVEKVPESFLSAFVRQHQNVGAMIKGEPEFEMSSLYELDESKILILDGVEDPQNLGAIMRTAWLMGVQVLILPEFRSVSVTPVVHKVASGGVEHVPVLTVGNFEPILKELKEMGYWVFGLSHKSTQSLHQMKLPAKTVWVLGSEDKGLRVTTERLCDELVSIPQLSANASYNVSVAAGMALFETQRQNTAAKTSGSSKSK